MKMLVPRLTGFLLILVCAASAYRSYCHHPRSCKEILRQDPKAVSGLYVITTSGGKLEVYCEMVLDGGGFTFLPRKAVSTLKAKDLQHLHSERNKVLLRIQRSDGRQSYTVIRQLPQFGRLPIAVKLNSYSGYTRPVNWQHLGKAIYLGIIPAANARVRRSVQGFVSNGAHVQFTNCDGNPNNYFAFYENAKEAMPSRYHAHNLVYERQGIAVNWRRSGKVVNSLRNLPNKFFFLTELHFGGCGTYTSSDRWGDAIGTAIGVK